jgi:hypothetical protein
MALPGIANFGFEILNPWNATENGVGRIQPLSGLNDFFLGYLPRVARASQPWAE